MTERQFLRRSPKALRLDYGSLEANADDVGLFCLSRSSWMLARNLVEFYGGWRSRYVEDITAGQLRGVTDAEWSDIQQWFERTQAELEEDMSCDFSDGFASIAQAINSLTSAIESQSGGQVNCGCDSGTQFDDPPSGDLPPIGPGEEYETEQEYLDARCNVANSLVDSLRSIVNQLDTASVETIAEVSIGAALTFVIAAIASTGAGALLLAVLGLAAAILTAAIASAVNLSSIRVAIDNVHDDLICALYEASDPDEARSDFLDILETELLTPAELALVSLMLPNHAVNQLFSPSDAQMIAYQGSFDCSSCASVFCEIDYEIGTGTFVPGQFYNAGSADPGAPDPHIVRWETRDVDPNCVCLNNVVLEIGETTARTDFTVVLQDCEGNTTNPLVGGQLVQGQVYGPAAQLNITAPQAGGAFSVNVSVYKQF